MTLIIGCITSEFAILAGDTQLTVGDLRRGENLKREVEIKVNQFSSRFMMGIMGKWSWFYASKDGPATYINKYDTLSKGLGNKDSEVEYLQKFLANSSDIDATALYINRTKNGYEMNSVSSQEDRDLSRLKLGNVELMFNEPFSNYSKTMVSDRLNNFSQTHQLNEGLADSLFLINNIILEAISKGRDFDIQTDEGLLHLNTTNTIGGYLTIQIMTSDIHYFNCLYRPYSYDNNTLLDKTTYPFSSFIDGKPEINYLDNLLMLIKASVDQRNNEKVKEEISQCIAKQILFLSIEKIVKTPILNEVILEVNKKYNLTLQILEVEPEEQMVSLAFLLEEEHESFDFEYIRRFI